MFDVSKFDFDKELGIRYMVVTIGVEHAVESRTVVAVFNAIGKHPSIEIGSTLSLYGDHCANVHELNLKIVTIT